MVRLITVPIGKVESIVNALKIIKLSDDAASGAVVVIGGGL